MVWAVDLSRKYNFKYKNIYLFQCIINKPFSKTKPIEYTFHWKCGYLACGVLLLLYWDRKGLMLSFEALLQSMVVLFG